jgi:hypothetical protein
METPGSSGALMGANVAGKPSPGLELLFGRVAGAAVTSVIKKCAPQRNWLPRIGRNSR